MCSSPVSYAIWIVPLSGPSYAVMLLGLAILLRSFLRCSLSLSLYKYYARQSENVTYTSTSFLFRTSSALSSPVSALAFARYYLRDGFSSNESHALLSHRASVAVQVRCFMLPRLPVDQSQGSEEFTALVHR